MVNVARGNRLGRKGWATEPGYRVMCPRELKWTSWSYWIKEEKAVSSRTHQALVPFTFCESHCKPSNNPSPVVAQLHGMSVDRRHVSSRSTHLGCTYHVRSRILCRPNFSVTSAGDMATRRDQERSQKHRRPSMYRATEHKPNSPPGRSCLFANTINRQSFISRSARIRSSSSFASSILSRSPESMTKIRP